MLPTIDKRPQRPHKHPSRARASQQARGKPGQHTPSPPVLHRRQHARQHLCQRNRGRTRCLTVHQEPRNQRRDVQLSQNPAHLSRRDHMPGNKAAQRPSQPCFLRRDDGRVRNWQPQRVSEQRRYCEPIRNPTNKTGLRARLQQIPPKPRRHGIAQRNEPPHRHQQSGRERLVPKQVASCIGVGIIQHGPGLPRALPVRGGGFAAGPGQAMVVRWVVQINKPRHQPPSDAHDDLRPRARHVSWRLVLVQGHSAARSCRPPSRDSDPDGPSRPSPRVAA